MTDTTTCPTCAATLPAAAVFCTNCGARLGGAPPVPASAPPPPPVDPTRVDNPGLTGGVTFGVKYGSLDWGNLRHESPCVARLCCFDL